MNPSRSNYVYGAQLLATWRTDATCSVGRFELTPLSRVAVAPDPVAPAAPVGPRVPAAGVALFESVPRTSTLLFTYLLRLDWSPPWSRYDVADALASAAGAPAFGAPAVPAPLVAPVAPGFAPVRMKPDPEAEDPAVLPPVAPPPTVEALASPAFKQPVIVTWLPGG